MRLVFRTLHLTTIGIDNHISSLQEFVGNIDSGFQIATAILLQVQNHILHALSLKLFDALHKLVISLCPKITDTDIADAWTNHIGGIDGMNGNLIANHGECQFILDA